MTGGLHIPHTNGIQHIDIQSHVHSTSENNQHKAEILFITSFPPRECGIATYSQDLMNAMERQFRETFTFSVCALESDQEQPEYTIPPKYTLNTSKPESYRQVATKINDNPYIQCVVIQHEFGFFAECQPAFLQFIENIRKPLIIVFHTVLPNPDEALKRLVQTIVKNSISVIVMTHNAAALLIHDYEAAEDIIQVIPHGTHLVPALKRTDLKRELGFSGRKVLTTFGLLSSGKGIEITLQALPAIVQIHPDVLFLILGKTHPGVLKQEGEKYREMLQQIIKDLKLERNVKFVNEYVALPKLLSYLQLTDIYLFTSKDPHQAVSGTFAYAMSSGCPVISTAFPHALEVLNGDQELIIEFDNSKQLSEKVINLLGNKSIRKSKSLDSLHKMAPTAWENAALMHAHHFMNISTDVSSISYSIPPIHLVHIQKLSTAFGMIQFSDIAQPQLLSGYALDDNARAMIAMCQHYELTHDAEDLVLINTYLSFIAYCLQPNGKFLNYINTDREFTSQNEDENLEDSNGRAIWALGYVASLKNILPVEFIQRAESVLLKAIPQLHMIYSTRAMAFIIKGLHFQQEEANKHLIVLFADRLIQMYRHESVNNWLWFEPYMTYGNSVLSEALLCAYISIEDETYLNTAKLSFDFLLVKIFNGNQLNVISNKGWYIKDQKMEHQVGGEQPIDVAYTIVALERFYRQFALPEYKEKAIIAFNWFLGENHLHQIVYNPCTGGCYDGVEEFNVNLNQGAESTVSYLMARLSVERILSPDFEFANGNETLTHLPETTKVIV
jgi:glycosyltransferase involved in cell wall biosynthesis